MNNVISYVHEFTTVRNKGSITIKSRRKKSLWKNDIQIETLADTFPFCKADT